MIKYVDLFSGVGGFRYGIKKAQPDWECVYSNEWDKYANSVYRKHYRECDSRDIREVAATEIPDHDLLVGGFPCQSFSIAGKRGGFNDTRGTMFFEVARILKDKRPRYLLLENVKGLLSHDSGKTFQTILGVLSDLRYRVEWQILNSKHFGVPQNRERVFIVGHSGGEGGFQVFPIGKNDEIYIETNRKSTGRQVSNTLSKKSTSGMNARGTYIVHNVYGGFGETKFREFKDYSPTIRTPKGGGHLPMVVEDFYPDRIRAFKQSPTLRGDRQGLKVKEGMSIRRLTPVECERLQGFPDKWTEKGLAPNGDYATISDTQRYRCLGNAVTTTVITTIGRKFIEILQGR